MDLSVITEIINNLGFPIAMVAYFIWDKNKTMQPVLDSINHMNTLLEVLINKYEISEGGEKHE